jgi:nucleotide sugar dehydrogenase
VTKIRVGIVGCGKVGKAVHNLLRTKFDVELYDPPLAMGLDCDPSTWEAAFVCVPTPPAPNGSCDISIVREAVKVVPASVLLICHSTVAVGTTDILNEERGGNIVFSPEFVGTTPGHLYADLSNLPFLILGGYEPSLGHAEGICRLAYGPKTTVLKTSPRTAELVKYADNTFLALKVAFFNELYDLARALSVDFEELRSLLLFDSRIGMSHSLVFPAARGFSGECLPKDVSALLATAMGAGVSLETVSAALRANLKWHPNAPGSHLACGLQPSQVALPALTTART